MAVAIVRGSIVRGYGDIIFLLNTVKLLGHNLYCIKRYINKGDLT